MNDSSSGFINASQQDSNTLLKTSKNSSLQEVKEKVPPYCYHSKKMVSMKDQRLDQISTKFMRKHIPVCEYCKIVNENIRRVFLNISKNIPYTELEPSAKEDVDLELKELTKIVYQQYNIGYERNILEAWPLLNNIKNNFLMLFKSKEVIKYFLVSLITAVTITLFK